MSEITIYEKSTCSKCRVALSMADASGNPVRRVRYHEERLTREKLTELMQKLGMPPASLVRTNEPLYKELGLSVEHMNADEVVEILVTHPDLLQRPILECGERAIIGRDSKVLEEFLASCGS